MSLREEMDLLRNIPLFSKIDSSKLKLIAFTSERLQFVEGDIICKQGEMGDASYVVMCGRAEVLIETPKGPLQVNVLKKNDTLGEVSILNDVPRTATVRAVENMEVLRIDKEFFMRLMEEFPSLTTQLVKELARRLEVTTARLSEVAQECKELQAKADGQ